MNYCIACGENPVAGHFDRCAECSEGDNDERTIPVKVAENEIILCNRQIHDLALIVVTLTRRLPKDDPARMRALDYLHRKGLTPSVLR